MVRLRATKAMVAAIRFCEANNIAGWPLQHHEGEPLLEELETGQPISHSQVIGLSSVLRAHFKASGSPGYSESVRYDLAHLLRGSEVYNEPPKPRAEPVRELENATSANRC